MTDRNAKDENLDGLLQRALADDLPADVAAGMREGIARFREAKTGGEAADRGRAAAWSWLFRRGVWAVLSILMLVAGALLQGLGSPNRLANEITQVMTEIAGARPELRPGFPIPLIKENEP